MIRKSALITLLFCLFLPVSRGQIYSYSTYGVVNNVPLYVYAINQSSDGYLWVSRSNAQSSGLSRFDGFTFYDVQFPDSVSNRLITTTYRDSGGTLWFGSNDGSVFYAGKSSLVKLDLENERSISAITGTSDGKVCILPQGKAIFVVDQNDGKKITKYNLNTDADIRCAAAGDDGTMLLGSSGKLLICTFSGSDAVISNELVNFDDYAITAIIKEDGKNRFIIGTDGNGLLKLDLSDNKQTLTRFSDHTELDNMTIRSIMKDTSGKFWISTSESGVVALQILNDGSIGEEHFYNNSSGLGTNYINTVFQDNEGNFWFGTYGQGFSRLTSYAFGYYLTGEKTGRNSIIYVNSLNKNYLLGTATGFHTFNANTNRDLSFTDLSRSVGSVEITSYLLDNYNNLWIGTAGGGLYLRTIDGPVRRFFRSGDSGADNIRDIEITGDDIWLATTNGLLVVNRKSGLETHRFDINNGLPHNSIEKIMVTNDGSICVGTESDRLFTVGKDYSLSQGNGIMYGSNINKINAFAQDKNGYIWAATRSNGAFRFINDSVFALNLGSDLNSPYCYSILADADNNIWIGHEKGFSRYNPDRGMMRFYGADFTESGVCNPDAIYESADNKILIGTTNGLIIYDKEKDRKTETPPVTNINYIMINDVKYDYKSSFSLPYRKHYDIRINYVGICFSNPSKVYYSTFMENYNSDWSKLSTNMEVLYSLRDGRYKFNLVAVNEDGASQEKALSFNIVIARPFWRTWWFILLATGVVAGTVYIIVREREKAQLKIQEYLEKELEARTRVVMQQKGEIELQNIEITDSINYAKRIQSSILPDITKMKESFRDAFILFQPRDIVSGDFYWFDRIDDDRFMIVCADSTGHGVPGAFMSMIGSTLLQDIITRKMVTKPSEVLNLLDRQIFSTLNQNLELGVSNDGMDMVVCDFNIKTRHLRFASAMRPVIIILEGESYYIKGNRSSIGGESVSEKFFDDQEYYLSEGDALYLFSDGISDQFGGPDGKKMKIARLRKLIEQVTHLPMDEQKESVVSFYNEWKGNYDQVDDILLMGVRV